MSALGFHDLYSRLGFYHFVSLHIPSMGGFRFHLLRVWFLTEEEEKMLYL